MQAPLLGNIAVHLVSFVANCLLSPANSGHGVFGTTFFLAFLVVVRAITMLFHL